jgi:hypothetical protein
MKFLSTILFLFLYNQIISQSFPIKIDVIKEFDECSECQVKTRSVYKLMNKSNYNNSILECIESYINDKYSLPEKLNWYLKEQEYDKPCTVTYSGKHNWKAKTSNLSDKYTENKYLECKEINNNKLERIKKEEQKEQDSKNEKQNFELDFQKRYTDLQTKRTQAKELIKKNDIQNYLTLQLDICNEGRLIDSLKEIYYNKWVLFKDDEESNKITDQYFCDLSNYIWYSIKEKQINNTNYVLKQFGNVSDIEKLLNNRTPCNASLAVNLTHSILLQKNLKEYWFPRVRLFNDEIFPILLEDYKKFEKLGVLKSADSVILILKASKNKLLVNVSKNASSNTKYAADSYSIANRIKENYYDVIKIDNYLYKFTFRHSNDALIDDWNFKTFYFYFNNNNDVIIVNKSPKNVSEKKKLKIINQCLEIRNKDLNIK